MVMGGINFSMFNGGRKPGLYPERKKAEHRVTIYPQVSQLPSSSSSHSNVKCCIYRVDGYDSKEMKEFYEPKVISIGPMFWKDERLRAMEELKLIYRDSFLKHPKSQKQGLEYYLEAVGKRKVDIYNCYQDKEKLSSWGGNDDEFIRMIVTDAAFLLCLFMTNLVRDSPLAFTSDPQVPDELRLKFHTMETDLLIMGNQIPFFVLEDMFYLAFPKASEVTLINLACSQLSFFNIPGGDQFKKMAAGIQDKSKIKHLLDLYITCCCSSLPDSLPFDKERCQYPATAKALSLARVKFKVSKDPNLLCIKFNEKTGVLSIPHILANAKAEVFLQNLLRFEQCHYFDLEGKHAYFSDLFSFLNSLIRTADDIEILEESGVLTNVLGSYKRPAHVFNNLMANVRTQPYCNHYADVSKRLNAYSKQPWNQWIAIFRRNYLSSPWSVLKLFAGIITFGFGAVGAYTTLFHQGHAN